MPNKKWIVSVKFGEQQQTYNVEAFTEDGAMSAASVRYRDYFGRLPHEEDFLKVEEECPVPESQNYKASRSTGKPLATHQAT